MINLNLFEPITAETLKDLKPGEWIWDNEKIFRSEHKRTLNADTVIEPKGFRQIHIIDLKDFPRFSSKPFMLSAVAGSYRDGGYVWTYFEENRFYRLKERTND